ncbi:hypothetical protein A2U01_0095699 [Trifolium medium]|uniref:Uncharacterized protein n=1 Tax=Trifolium medium TaxID=97028 RepID=A0A392URP1_9FABA|nr:hypothetical protein [Trifolium medium]
MATICQWLCMAASSVVPTPAVAYVLLHRRSQVRRIFPGHNFLNPVSKGIQYL